MLREFFRYLLFLILMLPLFGTGILRAEVIDTDTVWSGEIFVADKIIVDKGATLLIAPGSRVTFRPMPEGAKKGGGRLIIFGRLIAQGTEEAPIFFTSAATAPQAGDWEGIRFEKADQRVSRVDFCIIEYARTGISGRYSALQVAKTHFRNNLIGLAARNGLKGSLFDCLATTNTVGVRFEQNNLLRVVNCRIENNQGSGIVCSNSSPIIQNSSVISNGEHGVFCLRGSSPLIEDNLIRGNQYGVWAEMNSSPTILLNEIVNNDTAIGLERLSFAVIEANLIHQNRIGLFCNLGGYPHIHKNNIFDNRELAIDLGSNQSIVVARETPFDRRAAMNLPVPGQTKGQPDEDLDVDSSFPTEGLIDAYGNWWGRGALKELRSGEANVSFFEDGYDTANLSYMNKTYPRDRVGYAGWFERRIEQSTRRTVQYSGVKGRVLLDESPVVGARVHVYSVNDTTFENEGMTFSAPTGSDGQFLLPLKSGSYRLIAIKSVPPTIKPSFASEVIERLSSIKPVVVTTEEFISVNIPLKPSFNPEVEPQQWTP